MMDEGAKCFSVGSFARMNNVNSQKSPQKAKTGLREIAAAANVSIATVSRVLNGSSRVDPGILKTVLNAAEKLNVDLSQRNKTKALAFRVLADRLEHGEEIPEIQSVFAVAE